MSQTSLLVWLTSTADHQDHVVTALDMEAGCAAGRGEYLALCGDDVVVGSMHEPPGSRCARCRELVDPYRPRLLFGLLSLGRRCRRG